ncbi:hypothetical protein HDU85_006590 [Gaertneriomyces sp. JEL0708]|nr:hypothetical protein HDU85_006590 [Gaertneriomyces sp. JEL0708]
MSLLLAFSKWPSGIKTEKSPKFKPSRSPKAKSPTTTGVVKRSKSQKSKSKVRPILKAIKTVHHTPPASILKKNDYDNNNAMAKSLIPITPTTPIAQRRRARAGLDALSIAELSSRKLQIYRTRAREDLRKVVLIQGVLDKVHANWTSLMMAGNQTRPVDRLDGVPAALDQPIIDGLPVTSSTTTATLPAAISATSLEESNDADLQEKEKDKDSGYSSESSTDSDSSDSETESNEKSADSSAPKARQPGRKRQQPVSSQPITTDDDDNVPLGLSIHPASIKVPPQKLQKRRRVPLNPRTFSKERSPRLPIPAPTEGAANKTKVPGPSPLRKSFESDAAVAQSKDAARASDSPMSRAHTLDSITPAAKAHEAAVKRCVSEPNISLMSVHSDLTTATVSNSACNPRPPPRTTSLRKSSQLVLSSRLTDLPAVPVPTRSKPVSPIQPVGTEAQKEAQLTSTYNTHQFNEQFSRLQSVAVSQFLNFQKHPHLSVLKRTSSLVNARKSQVLDKAAMDVYLLGAGGKTVQEKGNWKQNRVGSVTHSVSPKDNGVEVRLSGETLVEEVSLETKPVDRSVSPPPVSPTFTRLAESYLPRRMSATSTTSTMTIELVLDTLDFASEVLGVVETLSTKDQDEGNREQSSFAFDHEESFLERRFDLEWDIRL